MNRFRLTLCLLFILAFTAKSGFGTHIIGGEIIYKYLGNDVYHITLKIYRDCHKGNIGFDEYASVGFFDKDNTYLGQIFMTSPDSVKLTPVLNNPCVTIPDGVCVTQAVYETNVLLPPIAGGYQMAYQRCCRNRTINNIIAPGATGATYYTIINDTAIVKNNDSPYFKELPPILICKDEPLIFDHAAIDPDNDSLVYSMCQPFSGANDTIPQPQPPYNPPYSYIEWAAPYSTVDPLGGIPLSIDSKTGLLTGTPNKLGQFVVGVCVKEYRKGVLLGTNKRDFQFNVLDCPPVPTLSVPPTIEHCGENDIYFQNYSENAFSYDWDFNLNAAGNDQSNLPDPTYSYPAPGSYNIRLIVNKDYKCADTAYSTVNVFPVSQANFNSNDDCENKSIFFSESSSVQSGKIVNWNWEFGDGKTSNIQNPNHSYSNDGNYNATLIVTSDHGCKDTVIKSLTIYDTPVPNFFSSVACDDVPVQFSDSTTIKNDVIKEWNWDFGDGGSSSKPNPLHPFSYQSNNYNITLTATSSHGCTGKITRPLIVHPLPVINFIAPDNCEDISITFDDKSTIKEDLINKWKWNFPDNTYDTIQNPKHSFGSFGSYAVSLTATSNFGCSDSATKQITIYPKPKPDFTFTRQCLNYLNRFWDSSTAKDNDLTAWKWDFDDGFISSDQNASRIYQKDGIYYVKLTVTTSKGCIDSVTKKVNVFPAPDANFEAIKAKDCPPFKASFSPLDTLDIEGYYLWNFGNGDTASGMHVSHVYKKTGTYPVSLTVISSQGCIDTVRKDNYITVYPFPKAAFTFSPRETPFDLPFVQYKDASSGVSSWTWNFNDNTLSSEVNPLHAYQDTGWFKTILTVTNDFGCIDTASGYVYIKPVFAFHVPNAFTPDNNSKNDKFFGYGVGIKEYELLIFNRWGEKIFETHNIYEGWDGTTNGLAAPQDSYVYKIFIKDVFKKTHRYVGIVTLVR